MNFLLSIMFLGLSFGAILSFFVTKKIIGWGKLENSQKLFITRLGFSSLIFLILAYLFFKNKATSVHIYQLWGGGSIFLGTMGIFIGKFELLFHEKNGDLRFQKFLRIIQYGLSVWLVLLGVIILFSSKIHSTLN